MHRLSATAPHIIGNGQHRRSRSYTGNVTDSTWDLTTKRRREFKKDAHKATMRTMKVATQKTETADEQRARHLARLVTLQNKRDATTDPVERKALTAQIGPLRKSLGLYQARVVEIAESAAGTMGIDR